MPLRLLPERGVGAYFFFPFLGQKSPFKADKTVKPFGLVGRWAAA